MFTVSLCMIVKDEEAVLGRCLDSVKGLVDEIIIVDTGSKDKTCEVAKQYTEQVYSFAWIDDFAAARNYSFSKATKDYCMWLDADDVIEESEYDAFKKLKEMTEDNIDIVMMRYNVSFDKEGLPTFWYYRERWIRNDHTHFWQGAVHEVISPNGKVIYSDAAVSHRKEHVADPDRNLNIYRKLIAAGKELDPRQQYYYARELFYHEEYEAALTEFRKFLKRQDGWIENKIEACILGAECHSMLGASKEVYAMLFQSFQYDSPRAEVCCRIGENFMKENKHELAIYWYQCALKDEKERRRGGFIEPDYYDYIPFMQLCVCYEQIGQSKKAAEYNERAGACKPDSSAYLFNKTYFESKKD